MKKNNQFKVLFHLITCLVLTLSCEKDKENDNPFLPISTHIIKDNKEVFFYGSQHSNEPSDPMFNEIEEYFITFHADLVLIEGGYHTNKYESEDAAIKDGEMAFVSYLATCNKITKENIEPLDKHIDSLLLLNYTSEQILSMYVLRQMCQYKDQYNNHQIDFSTEVTSFTNKIIQRGILEIHNELTIDEILDIINAQSNLGITVDNWREISLNRYVYDGNNTISEIRDKVGEIRDEHAIQLIMTKLNEYDKIFVIMGRQHLIVQEPELRRRIESEY